MMAWMGFIISLFKLFCWSAFFIALLHTLIAYLLLWVEQRSTLFIHKKEDPLPYQRMLVWLKCIFQEFGIIFLKSLTYPFACLFPDPLGFLQKPLSSQKNSKTPVIFVNGYFCAASIWWHLAFQLKKQFIQESKSNSAEIPSFYYNSFFKNPFAAIPEMAQLLQHQIKQIRTETGAEQVILVAFSMGGLIASYMSEYLAQPGEVAKVISIGTPFEGTRMAALGIGENAAQMLPGSSFVTALVEKIEQSKVSYYCVASQMDNDIIPWSSAIVHADLPPHRLLVVEDCGHLGLLFSKAVIAKLYTWMND